MKYFEFFVKIFFFHFRGFSFDGAYLCKYVRIQPKMTTPRPPTEFEYEDIFEDRAIIPKPVTRLRF